MKEGITSTMWLLACLLLVPFLLLVWLASWFADRALGAMDMYLNDPLEKL